MFYFSTIIVFIFKTSGYNDKCDVLWDRSNRSLFQGLDLATPLYLGGHPKVSDLGYGQGFIGCISQLKINGDDIDITPKNGVLGTI